jgi:hypothetical protein
MNPNDEETKGTETPPRRTAGCCGGPAKERRDACCARDEAAKEAGRDGCDCSTTPAKEGGCCG